MEKAIVLPGRFRGPATTANGGYAAGAVAELVEGPGPAEVSLRRPPPIDRPLAVRRSGPTVELLDGDEVVLAGEPGEPLAVELPPLDLASVPTAGEVLAALPDAHGAPTCFVCGPASDDGLRVFPGVVGDGVVACRWRAPHHLGTREWWALLDCPGGWAIARPPGEPQPFFPALARLSCEVQRPLHPGEEVVVVGWRTGTEGRRHHAATAVVGLDGEVLGAGRQTCVALPPDWAMQGA